MVSAVEMAVNPKKRVFLALVLFSAIMHDGCPPVFCLEGNLSGL